MYSTSLLRHQAIATASPKLGSHGTKQNAGLNEQKAPHRQVSLPSRDVWWPLLSGVPSRTRGSIADYLTVLVNLVLVIMVLDATFYARYMQPSHSLVFSRVGYVSHDTAKILVRDPSATALPISLQIRPANPEQMGGGPTWQPVSSSAVLTAETDFTTVYEVQGLRSNTRYEYMASNNETGFFKTASPPASERSSAPFTFLHSSCIIPNFPYVPFRHHLEFPGLKHLAQRLPELQARFMLFLGDFIYVDVPFRFGVDKETYRREYRQAYASPDWQSVTQQKGAELPWLHVYDDHEIANDWDKNETGVYSSAADPWQIYQAAVNPPALRPDASYFSFVEGPASFFLMDTRRYRTPFDGTNGTWTEANAGAKSMLGAQQRQDLVDWISREEAAAIKWKIVVSSIPFTKNWRFGSEDTWAGYLGERQVILEAMWEASAKQSVGIVVLSGDRHEFAATAFPPPTQGPKANQWPAAATVHEFSASPLSQFYLPIRTYRQEDDEDVCIKYLPDGNSKFGSLTMHSSPASAQSILDYRLFIDGKVAWAHTLTTPLVATESPTWGVFSWFRDTSKPHLVSTLR